MTYSEWCDIFGQYRWYKKNGESRTYLPLDYEWEKLYKIVTEQSDLRMAFWEIPCDIYEFTNAFLTEVPTAWLKFKTEAEFYFGTLDGTTIKADEFRAGTKRESSRIVGRNNNENIGAREDSQTSNNDDIRDSEIKNRQLEYVQGIQSGIMPNNDNIGEMGVDYSSGITDNVQKSHDEGHVGGSAKLNTGAQEITENETVVELFKDDSEYINYYDQLAFNRERIEKLNLLKPMYTYFEHLFTQVEAMSGWWNYGRMVEQPFWPTPGINIV